MPLDRQEALERTVEARIQRRLTLRRAVLGRDLLPKEVQKEVSEAATEWFQSVLDPTTNPSRIPADAIRIVVVHDHWLEECRWRVAG